MLIKGSDSYQTLFPELSLPQRGGYEMVQSYKELHDNTTIIVVSGLYSEYVLYLGRIQLIISQAGSSLSHLALVAREQRLPIIVSPRITTVLLSPLGELMIEKDGLYLCK